MIEKLEISEKNITKPMFYISKRLDLLVNPIIFGKNCYSEFIDVKYLVNDSDFNRSPLIESNRTSRELLS